MRTEYYTYFHTLYNEKKKRKKKFSRLLGEYGVYAFPKGISPKVNVVVWLKSKLTYFKATVQHLSHYLTDIPHKYIFSKSK